MIKKKSSSSSPCSDRKQTAHWFTRSSDKDDSCGISRWKISPRSFPSIPFFFTLSPVHINSLLMCRHLLPSVLLLPDISYRRRILLMGCGLEEEQTTSRGLRGQARRGKKSVKVCLTPNWDRKLTGTGPGSLTCHAHAWFSHSSSQFISSGRHTAYRDKDISEEGGKWPHLSFTAVTVDEGEEAERMDGCLPVQTNMYSPLF